MTQEAPNRTWPKAKCAICAFIEGAKVDPRTAVMATIVKTSAVVQSPGVDFVMCPQCESDLARAILAHNRLVGD